jgi:anti-anti-sigma regulatory factor
MNIAVKEAQGRVLVTVMQLQGELDASNYLDVIAKAKEVYQAGTRYLLFDLSDLSHMSSAGLMALHSTALIMRGAEPPDPEYGWSAYHSMARDREGGMDQHCKILNPQPSVDRTLQITGFKAFFEVHTDMEAALASF